MTVKALRFVSASVFAVLAGVSLAAQQPAPPQAPAPIVSNDPRVGLKAGITDAGIAARHMELVANLPRPEGFFDPKALGDLNYANSDLAFKGNMMFLGNFHGFNFYDVEDPRRPKLRTSVQCPGGQGDVSIYGNLLFMSVEQTRGRLDCGLQGVTPAVSAERFRGVRIFDITDIDKPTQIAAVQTCRGSHTHTLVVDPDDKQNIYVYGSGTGGVRSGDELAGCSGGKPEEDANTALFSIDVIQVPLATPAAAKIVSRPRIFADLTTGAISGLWAGGDHGPGTQRTSTTNQCHDITTYPELGLAAGACSGNGILLDISDPVNPKRLDHVSDKNFAYWHSATFNNDGTKVIFTDEWGGGTRPRCQATDLPTWGANAIFDIKDRKMQFGSYYKMPAPQTDKENCVAHNGSLIPVPGRDIMVQAWYQGGLSIFDFTDPKHPVEIAFFDRGPIDAVTLTTAGYWSTYWYNGFIYGSEIARGVDIFRLKPSEFLSQNEIDAAGLVRMDTFNAQHQPKMAWPAHPTVGRAYLDQLTRSKGLQGARASAVKSALDRAEKARSSRDKSAAATQLGTVAADLESAATGADAARMRALATTLKDIAATLR
ncbi:MAG: hypothetical protein M3R55_13805 [Acidobacteriota bacterium]|nr:hypothetical protein [Acidobacteriota bacterium]